MDSDFQTRNFPFGSQEPTLKAAYLTIGNDLFPHTWDSWQQLSCFGFLLIFLMFGVIVLLFAMFIYCSVMWTSISNGFMHQLNPTHIVTVIVNIDMLTYFCLPCLPSISSCKLPTFFLHSSMTMYVVCSSIALANSLRGLRTCFRPSVQLGCRLCFGLCLIFFLNCIIKLFWGVILARPFSPLPSSLLIYLVDSKTKRMKMRRKKAKRLCLATCL